MALGCVVMPICLVRQRIHALPYLAAYCSVSALPEKYRHFFGFSGKRLCESDSGYTLMRQSAAPPPNFTNFLRENGLDTFIPDSVLRPLCLFRLRSTNSLRYGFTKMFSYSVLCLVRRIHAHMTVYLLWSL